MLSVVYFCVVIIIVCLQLFTSSLVACPSIYQEIPAVIPVKCGPKSSSQSSTTITFWYMLINEIVYLTGCVCGDCECMCIFIHIGLYTTSQM